MSEQPNYIENLHKIERLKGRIEAIEMINAALCGRELKDTARAWMNNVKRKFKEELNKLEK